MFEKYNNYAFVALDFDKTIVSGHMHQYFMTLYPDKSPDQIVEIYNEISIDDFRNLLIDIAAFTHLNDSLNFVNNLKHPDRKELCDIFRSKFAIQQLNTKYGKDFSDFQPFIAEKELKEFLEYRIDHDLPTAIVSNSMFAAMIKETLFVLLGEPYHIKIYTPDCDPTKTIRDNAKDKLYIPHLDKNALLLKAKSESGTVMGKSALIDDEPKNCTNAQIIGFEAEEAPPMYNPFIEPNKSSDTVYEEPFGSRSPSPMGELCLTPPATISGQASASSSTAFNSVKLTGIYTCPTYDPNSVDSIADRLDNLLAQQRQNTGWSK